MTMAVLNSRVKNFFPLNIPNRVVLYEFKSRAYVNKWKYNTKCFSYNIEGKFSNCATQQKKLFYSLCYEY